MSSRLNSNPDGLGPVPDLPVVWWCQKYTCKVPKHHQDEEFWIDQSSFGGYFPSVLWMLCVIFRLQKSLSAKKLRYSQTSNPLGIMTSFIFNVHWSSITPGTEKAPWDCVHLKVLYDPPSHEDCGNQKSCSESVLLSEEQESADVHIHQHLHVMEWCQSSSGNLGRFGKPPKTNPATDSCIHLENLGKKSLGQRSDFTPGSSEALQQPLRHVVGVTVKFGREEVGHGVRHPEASKELRS